MLFRSANTKPIFCDLVPPWFRLVPLGFLHMHGHPGPTKAWPGQRKTMFRVMVPLVLLCFRHGSAMVPPWFRHGSAVVPPWFCHGSAWFRLGSCTCMGIPSPQNRGLARGPEEASRQRQRRPAAALQTRLPSPEHKQLAAACSACGQQLPRTVAPFPV